MRYRIEIDMGNAAFGDENEGIELARILRHLANRCERNSIPAIGPIRDVNGNTVGEAEEVNG